MQTILTDTHDVANPTFEIPELPPKQDLETRAVLKAAAKANRHLAELKGVATSIPNQGILISTLFLQEAKSSSEIENIVTTHDELFQASLFPESGATGAAKEVRRYATALNLGFSQMRSRNGLITNNVLIKMFQHLKQTDGGFRETPGTKLIHGTTKKVVYVPPQSAYEVLAYMQALEKFINTDIDSEDELDPLVKMAIIHHQFETIHPFPDGNGRIGRILNVLYLTRVGLLNIPILYLSRAINDTKSEYYRLLQSVRIDKNWEPWILYILDAVTSTSNDTIKLIEGIKFLMSRYKTEIRSNLKSIYSQDLLNSLFRHPYTRIDFLANDLKISRQTSSKYLEKLSQANLLIEHKKGNSKYFINVPLVNLLSNLELDSENTDKFAHK